jgi:two-component system chemotaxis sensor kinase CheA
VEDSTDLINAFIEEAREHLPVIETSLLALEHKPEDQTRLNELFRSVHTIKGGAGFFGLTAISTLTHNMESLLSLARSHKLILTHSHIDVLLTSQDLLVQLIDDPQNSHNVNVETECRKLAQLIDGANKPIIDFHHKVETQPKKTKEIQINLPNSRSTLTYAQEHQPITPIVDNSKVDISSEINDAASQDLLTCFIEEAREAIPQIETCLLGLEINPGNMQQLNELFRNVHSIKGGASFLGLEKIAQLTHLMEDVLGLAKNAKLVLDNKCIDTLLAAYDTLTRLIECYQHQDNIDIDPLCQKLVELKPSAIEKNLSPLPEPVAIVTKSTTQNKATEKPEPVIELVKPIVEEENVLTHHAHETEETIRVHVKRLNKLIDLAGELVLVRNQIFRLCEPLIPQTPGLKVILHNFSRITSEMQEEIMSTRMQPVGVIFNKFPRLIRQLEKDLGKQLELVTEGADVELDKSIIEALTDPVTHIIRNMADHGIEMPAERIKKGKLASGTILQKAFHESGQVIIQLSDDGKGIDPDFIANKALQKEIISLEVMEKMTDKEKINLIFTPGFSTAETVSAVSGRGIGMDVVKTNIEACGGSIDINSQLDKWTSITMTLPLTMAIISALIVNVQNCRFAFPQGNLEEMVLLEAEDYSKKVGTVGNQRMLSLRGDFLPLISLAESLKMFVPSSDLSGFKNLTGLNECPSSDNPWYILIIKAENNRVAVIVDQILGSEEIVVKPMPEYFKQIKNFSGTSILGDGTIAMIIDVQGYIHSNRLVYTELQKDSSINKYKVDQEPQSLLIFDNNTEEHFALALSWIRRIDSLDIKRIQLIAGCEYIEYRGEQMRLLRLENCLPVQKPNSYQPIANIIIPKRTKVPVALLINRVIDTKNTVIKLEDATTHSPGILGSMLLEGKITLMLDLHYILEAGEPESVEKLEINLEKAKMKRILLVEDTPFFMKVIKECVVNAGYQVTTASNGREGLDILAEQEFDLVLSDIEMPLMTGWEMVKNIRMNPKWNAMPVIALTTLNEEQTVIEGKKIGFNEWLVKLDKELVLKTLARYL